MAMVSAAFGVPAAWGSGHCRMLAAWLAFWRLFLHGIINYIGFDMVISDVQPLMRTWNAAAKRVSF